MAIGKKTEVPEFGKAIGEDVQKEAADKLVSVESHRSCAVVFFAILPLESNLAVPKRYQAVIRNGDAVSIAAEVIEDLGGTSEGRFGIDDPF